MTRKYTVGNAARMVGVCVKTMQRWDRAGLLKANRTITGRRYYTDDHILLALGIKDEGGRSGK